MEDQAINRVHRLGQTKPVLIKRLVVSGTVETALLALQVCMLVCLCACLCVCVPFADVSKVDQLSGFGFEETSCTLQHALLSVPRDCAYCPLIPRAGEEACNGQQCPVLHRGSV